MNTYQQYAWQAQCANLSEKIVLLYCAHLADALTTNRVRIDPASITARLGVGVARVDAAISALHRNNVLYAHRWSDSGAWSITLPDLPKQHIPETRATR